MHKKLVVVSLLLVVLVASGVALADGTQTGSVGGTIKDTTGAPLPGVQVVVKQVSSGFTRTVFSTANGTYGARLLPPGNYDVTVSIAGFQTVTSVASVESDKNTLFDPVLKLSGVTETMNVGAEVPVIDKTNTNTQTTVNSNFTQKLAVGRSYQALVQLAPGVTGGANPNVHGSLSSNNVYLFDGVDTTDTATGTFGQNFNYEAIQEVGINTGGYSAEYGRASGAIVSVVTKSGGNAFHGSLKVIANNDQWDGQNYQTNQVTGASLQRTKFDEIQFRENATLGGPIWRDHLWFFGSFEYAKTTLAQQSTLGVPGSFAGENYQQARTGEFWTAKATWAATNQHSLEFSANGDPLKGIVVDYWGASAERNALTGQEQGGHVYRGNYQGIFSPSLSAEATFATSTSRIDVLPFQEPGAAPFYKYQGATVTTSERNAAHFDGINNVYFNGATFIGFVERPRTQFNIASNYYKQLGSMNHNLRVGFDYQKLESGAQFAYPGDVVYYDDKFNFATREFTPNEKQVFDPAVPSTSKGNVYSIYALDKVDFGRFFVNAGLRVDKQEGKSDVGRTTFDKTVFSPRIYFKYDVSGSGKQLVSGGYGRFYQSLTQSFSDNYAAIPQQGSYNDFFYNPATGKYDFDSRVEAGGNSLAVNGDLKPSYTDDFTLAFEQQIGQVLGVTLRGTYRKWNDLVDDVKTFKSGVRTIQYANYDAASRRYRGVELVFDKRFANNWQALVSYTLSRTEGNHFVDVSSALGDYLDNVGLASQGSLTGKQINEENKYGLASYDRTHDIKGYGAYSLSAGIARFVLGSTLGLRSGTTYQRQVTRNVAGTNFTRFNTPRGSDRFPWQFYWDLALQADVTVFKEIGFGIKGEVFNVTDTQTQGGGTAASQASFTDNANYGKSTSRNQFAPPRSFRLTALLTF